MTCWQDKHRKMQQPVEIDETTSSSRFVASVVVLTGLSCLWPTYCSLFHSCFVIVILTVIIIINIITALLLLLLLL